MPTYLISLDEMMRVTRTIGAREKHAFYWEDGGGFVVEYPVVTSDGHATGVVYRAEVPYEGLAAAIVVKNPASKESDIANVVVMFERVFLAEWFKKVQGEHRDVARAIYAQEAWI